ncbi:7276_t:CDS:2 [Funneliformis geosporum]|uniref:14733_t:CDS:1 n=1 Tax=Funneliformis geosporum TaxID=1117311 RepID=A0A9W4SWJ4_9GLOM|nr:7276_t:CDS:2 [Funneliformis geosporum]CAI2184064.1 14733_t:CDS:2 [Funneliformis geosporum]
MLDSITTFINNPEYHDILSIVKGFRNGAVYGAKIRLPHAFVMTFLFRTGSFKDKLYFIFDATKTHSANLAKFVTIYKTLMYLQRKMVGKEQNGHSFMAGLIGGYYVFGENNNVNQQLPVTRKAMDEPKHTFPIFAAVVWGIVMWLFRHDRDSLQPSLQASMQYLYLDSDYWNSIKNFLWHNK